MTVKRARQPSRKHLRNSLIAAALWTFSVPASALSLSEIKLHSGLHQPFNASILLRNFDPIEIDRVSVEIANDYMQAQYNSSNILPAPINAKIRSTKSGTYIDLTSANGVDEPYIKFAVQLNAPDGLIIRQYEVLLDPPKSLYTTETPAAPQKMQQAAAPMAVKNLKESIQLTAEEQAAGIEIATASNTALPETDANADTPKIHPTLGAAPIIHSALTAPSATADVQAAQAELPRVAALLDETLTINAVDAPNTEQPLYNSHEITDEEFLASLEKYSVSNMLATEHNVEESSLSSAIPETGALINEPKQAMQTNDKLAAEKPTRFAVQDNDFIGNDADSVARALMNYRDRARSGAKRGLNATELVKMSASGVKRISNTANPDQFSQ